MDIPGPPRAVAALAAFVRDRLAEVSDTLWTRRDGVEVLPAAGRDQGSVLEAARQLALVIVGAAAPFAPTSYSRARLIRQMHASGLLTGDEVRRTTAVIDLAPEPEPGRPGAPR